MSTSRLPFVALVSLLATLACQRGPESERATPAHVLAGPGLVFDNVRVFDGARDLGVLDVVVEGDRITHVGSLELPVDAAALGVEIIDGRDGALTLLPGLIDAHVHVGAADDLKRAITWGVTTELDQFMSERTMGMIKRQQAKGRLIDHADLRSAGTCATPPGGHGTEYGAQIPTLTSADQVDAWIGDRVDAGVDWVKIIYDDGHAFDRPFEILDEATLIALIEAAHANDLRAVVHVSDLEAARTAVDAGADGLAHLFFDVVADPAFVELAAQRDVFVMDTLAVMHMACGDAKILELLDDERLRSLVDPRRVVAMRESLAGAAAGAIECEALDASLALLHDAGVDILASTDTPNLGLDHGVAMHVELELLVAAGMSPSAALHSATELPARRFGLDDRGRIAAGLRADLLLVEGDPLAQIAATRSVVAVWKAGQAIELDTHREDIAARRATLADRMQAAPPAGSESGLVSDFDGDTLEVRFGAGWVASTDQMIGGTSTATIERAKAGAQGSAGALAMRGEVVSSDGPAWAGASVFMGDEPGTPANLSSFTKLGFWVKGAPGNYALMVFVEHRGAWAAAQSFEAGPEWAWVEFEFASLGVETWDLINVFVGSTQPGPLELSIDELRFE